MLQKKIISYEYLEMFYSHWLSLKTGHNLGKSRTDSKSSREKATFTFHCYYKGRTSFLLVQQKKKISKPYNEISLNVVFFSRFYIMCIWFRASPDFLVAISERKK